MTAGGPCMPKNPPKTPLAAPIDIWSVLVGLTCMFELKDRKYKLNKIRKIPSKILSMESSTIATNCIAMYENTENDVRIKSIFFQSTNFHMKNNT